MSKAKQAAKEACKQSEEVLAEQAYAALRARGNDAQLRRNMISFRHGDVNYMGTLLKASSIDKDVRTSIMDLLEENMRDFYAASSMGWNRREKQGELFDKSARFLVIQDQGQNLVAFVNWRFDIEECDEDDPQARPEEDVLEILYCYEVQIKSDHRSNQLGKLMMEMLHFIAKQSRMKKVMLTVFFSNQSARNFYKRIGYSSDLISPLMVEKGTSKADYDIMSLAIAF